MSSPAESARKRSRKPATEPRNAHPPGIPVTICLEADVHSALGDLADELRVSVSAVVYGMVRHALMEASNAAKARDQIRRSQAARQRTGR